jgi:diguanylate cyclase (GGDEF)-like protein
MQAALIIILTVFVAVLTYLLVVRVRREGRSHVTLGQDDLEPFEKLIKASIVEGDIQATAAHVSQMLREQFGCDKIIFLRRHGRLLELSYYHGLTDCNRRAFQVRYTVGLVEALRARVLPDTIDQLSDVLPRKALESLRQCGCDFYFPILWRDHVYGLYFMAGNDAIRSPAFRLIIASMAHTLSATYHVKWQEQKYGRLKEQARSVLASRRQRFETVATSMGLLKLVRHRDSETLIGKIVDEVKKDLDLERCTLLYGNTASDEPVRLLGDGSKLRIEPPTRNLLDRLLLRLESSEGALEIAHLGDSDQDLSEFGERLSQAGLHYLLPFKLTDRRPALFVWNDKRPAAEIASHLIRHRLSAADLMANAESFEEVESLSYTDNLTGLANQRYFVRRLDEEIDRARRYSRSLALIIFDIDELKGINDRYGHQAGDQVLRQMGSILGNSIRSIDVVARYGGDEFCIIMPESDRATCARFMQRLQQKIAGSRFHLDQIETEVTCTVSLGGGIFPDNAENPEQLIYAADMALLKAKESGRNRSFVFS